MVLLHVIYRASYATDETSGASRVLTTAKNFRLVTIRTDDNYFGVSSDYWLWHQTLCSHEKGLVVYGR